MDAALILIALIAICVAAIGAGIWLATRTRANPECGGCGYDVSASLGTTARCPECGRSFADVGVRPIRRRFDRRTAIIAIVMTIVAGASMTAMVGLVAATRARAQAVQAQAQAMAAQAQALRQAQLAIEAAALAEEESREADAAQADEQAAPGDDQ